jgi:hypothetical protein
MTRRRTILLLGTCVALVLLLAAAPSALAASSWWHVTTGWRPSRATPEKRGQVVVTVSNLGDAAASGESVPIVIADELPAGVEAKSIKGFAGERGGVGSRGPVDCVLASLTCTFSGTLPPYRAIEVVINVVVREPGVPVVSTSEATVTGGGARAASGKQRMEVGGESLHFGLEDYELEPEEEGGGASQQAGAHPFQLTTTLTLDQAGQPSESEAEELPHPVQLPKDVRLKWPPGLIGNPTAVPRCPLGEFLSSFAEDTEGVSACPAQTVVGVARVLVNAATSGLVDPVVPLFNLEPAPGEPARFGFRVLTTPVVIDASVRTGGDYGVTVSSSNIAQTVGFISSEVTVWGVPDDPRHDNSRGYGCLAESLEISHKLPCDPPEGERPRPFLSSSTACDGALGTTAEVDSWEHPGSFEAPLSGALPALDGCNRLQFHPSIVLTPEQTSAGTPTGLTADVHVPQEQSEDPNGLTGAEPRDLTVTLPEGLAVNPASGEGLQACSEGLAGYTGSHELESEPGPPVATFTPTLPSASELEPGQNFCPNASKVGTAKIKTPLLPNPIEGGVYVATQNENPFGSLLAIYVLAEDPVSGVTVKLTGQVHLSETGQIVTTFENTPQAPFEDAELHFFGGERASLATPAHCGDYEATASFTSWSSAEPVGSSSTFALSSGPNGAPCPGASLPFSPSFTGGTTTITAGSFTSLTTAIGREDDQQDLQSVQIRTPNGLSGLLTGVELCPEAQANAGTCGPESLIGETTVAAGVGSEPVTVKGGKIYLTEHYAGAPFGLSLVEPVKAGPFDLEHDTSNPAQDPACDCFVTRARVEVDPRTSELTVTTDTSGAHAIPRVIDGVPIEIKRVSATINRPHFTFNPTSCDPLSIAGTLTGFEGADQPLSTPFQLTNCAALKFAPKFTLSTAGHGSKANGTSLVAKMSFPKNAIGSEAWLGEVKLDLPKQLPARNSTLQQACLAGTFETDRPACPKASIIGHATVHTPVLPVPLEGPVYFVSYGAAKFPEAVFVLEGYGITVEQHSETFIDKKTGITSATFRTIPDVPIESLEVVVPQGPFSELGVFLPEKDHYDLCGHKLTAPTLLKAANGLVIHQNTNVTVTGCPKPHPKHSAKKKHKKS